MSSLAITVDMDTAGARAASVALGNSLKDLKAELNALDAQMKAAGAGATEQMRVDFVNLGGQTASLEKELSRLRSTVRTATSGAAEGMKNFEMGTAGSTRELIVLG